MIYEVWKSGKDALTRVWGNSSSFCFAGCWFLHFLPIILGVQIEDSKHVRKVTHLPLIKMNHQKSADLICLKPLDIWGIKKM
jgi:hypothetical protein